MVIKHILLLLCMASSLSASFLAPNERAFDKAASLLKEELRKPIIENRGPQKEPGTLYIGATNRLFKRARSITDYEWIARKFHHKSETLHECYVAFLVARDKLSPERQRQTLLAQINPAKTLKEHLKNIAEMEQGCLLYTSPSPRDRTRSRMPSSA